MTVKDLKTFYDYNYWANQKIISVIQQLTPDEFIKDVAGGYGSIRNTLVHILSTEWGWLSRCGGQKRGPSLKADNYPTVDLIISDWKKVEKYILEFLSQLSDTDLTNNVEYPGKDDVIRSMPVGELLHHSIIHAAHHRGQIAVLLRELGYSPGSFDILFFYAERNGVQAW